MSSTPGCERPKEPDAKPSTVYAVSIGTLMNEAERTYMRDGVLVRVFLQKGGYYAQGKAIYFPSPAKNAPPAVVFHCDHTVHDIACDIHVTGRVSAIVRDNIRRSNGVNYQVVVSECQVDPEP